MTARLQPNRAVRVCAALLSGMAAASCGTHSQVQADRSSLALADSALVGRILLAEHRRDSASTALDQGLVHGDERIRAIAWRADRRIRDPRFSARDSLPPVAVPTHWPEPSWRARYRALTTQRDDCAAMRTALTDSAWAVRLRAAQLVRASCAQDAAIASTLRSWVDGAGTSARQRNGVSWHAAANGIVAMARLHPADAGSRLPRLATHVIPAVRTYAARAAVILQDTAALRSLSRDSIANVREAAIEGLSGITGHADDAIYLDALESTAPQVARVAAIALKGSERSGVTDALGAALRKWQPGGIRNAGARDVVNAIHEALGRPAVVDLPSRQGLALPPRAVALALGEDIRLRVTMADHSGGGSFVVRLRGDVAPIMAARVLELARSGAYNNTAFHRAELDFVLQGLLGDNEYNGHVPYFVDELGTVPHARGTIGMSTRGHDTGDAQWFINVKDNLRLGADYTVFAEVVQGMDVVDDIKEGDVVARVEVLPAISRGAARRPPAS